MPRRRIRKASPAEEAAVPNPTPGGISARSASPPQPVVDSARRVATDNDVVIDVAPSPPLIPEGVYTARSTRVEKIRAFGRPMLRLDLEIFGGSHDGTKLSWYAALPEDGKRPGKQSKAKGPGKQSKAKGFSSKIGRAWELAAGRRPERGEHVSAKMLVGKMFKVAVKTVTQDHEKRPLSKVSKYSLIRDLLERDEGGSS